MNAEDPTKSSFGKRLVTYISLILLLIITVAGLSYFLQLNHDCDWTGLGKCSFVKQPNEEVRPAKTLWDWLELLIVPSVLASTGYIFNRAIQRSERARSEHYAKLERQIAEDGLRETALQSYLDKMSELLLDRKLRESSETDEVRAVARSKTLTVLRRLDGNRRAVLLRFLKETNLIGVSDVIVGLHGAQFDGSTLELVDLQGSNLESASLREAVLSQSLLSDSNLTDADLSKANLRNTDLRQSLLFRANLEGADLTGADLRGADLRFASLRGTRLVEANLESANVGQADISYADFTRAIIAKEQIATCRSVTGIIIPEIPR